MVLPLLLWGASGLRDIQYISVELSWRYLTFLKHCCIVVILWLSHNGRVHVCWHYVIVQTVHSVPWLLAACTVSALPVMTDMPGGTLYPLGAECSAVPSFQMTLLA
jgi:hypothetical protein